MVKLKTLLFRFLSNSAHYNFFTRLSLLIAASPVILKTALGDLVTQLNAWLAKETALMDWVEKSVLTEEIKEANIRMDRALTALRGQVRSQLLSVTSSIAKAAERVYNMLMSYGHVNVKPYEGQAGDVREIIRQVNSSKYSADVFSTLGLTALVYELQAAFTLFEQLLDQRDAESVNKPGDKFKDVRRGIEGVYHKIATVIDANAVVNTSNAYAEFINRLNPEIERLNEEFHHAKRNIAHSQPEDIPEQTYTGKPVTPSTFKVLYVTPEGTVQLELGRDYNLSFKKNVEVGVAECTIHGTGRYKGSKTITFVIVRVK